MEINGFEIIFFAHMFCSHQLQNNFFSIVFILMFLNGNDLHILFNVSIFEAEYYSKNYIFNEFQLIKYLIVFFFRVTPAVIHKVM